MRTCKACGCGVGMGKSFCPPCFRERRRTGSQRWPSRIRACPSCGAQRRSAGAKCRACEHQERRQLVPCPRCATPFWPWANSVSHARKFCSRPCSIVPKKPARVRPIAECLMCLRPFPCSHQRNTCCSRTCRNRYESRRRKLRLKGLWPSVVSPARIHRRDAGICALCREWVDPALPYPHPLSATVDHRVPLSRGGTHEEENLQLAHARCNLLKGNRVAA